MASLSDLPPLLPSTRKPDFFFPTASAQVSQRVSLVRENVLVRDDFESDRRMFRFERGDFTPSIAELHRICRISTGEISGKAYVAIDGFFSKEEEIEFTNFINTHPFPIRTYATPKAREAGEAPCLALSPREHLELLAKPLSCLNRLHELLGQIGTEMEGEFTTQPLLLVSKQSQQQIGAFVTNLVSHVSTESQDKGWHQDYDPEGRGLAYRLPHLEGKSHYPAQFVNGAPGEPLLLSLILYAANEGFSPEWGMGTLLRSVEGELTKIECRPMRILLFQGDIFHTMEASSASCPKDSVWKRLSYVMKMAIRPNDPLLKVSLKDRFVELFTDPASKNPSETAPCRS